MIQKIGSTDVSVYFYLLDTAGDAATALTISGLTLCYVRDGAAASANVLSALASATAAHSDNGGYEVDSTNAPGLYRIDVPDAAFASGVERVQLVVTGSSIQPAVIEVQLVGYTPSADYGGGDVDSTGTETITRDDALEIILGILGGNASFNTSTNVWTVYGRDGSTKLWEVTVSASTHGTRSGSEKDPA